MAINLAWPVSGERRADWDRMIQFYGLCEVLPDRARPAPVEKAFRDWATKRRLAFVEGENLVAFDPKAFNPKESLDRGRFGFLLRYLRPRDPAVFRRDLETAFSVRSMYVLEALKAYWVREGVVREPDGLVAADRGLLRLMGFTPFDLVQALDGVVKRDYLAEVVGGRQALDPAFAVEVGGYAVNFALLKERFLEGEFLVHAAGRPVDLYRLGLQMGVDDIADVRSILREARKRFDLNIEVTDEHVMFGPPSQKSIGELIAREQGNRQQLQQTEAQLRERQKAIKELLDRYSSREAKVLNEAETLREEGRVVWIKAKMVRVALQQLSNGRPSS